MIIDYWWLLSSHSNDEGFIVIWRGESRPFDGLATCGVSERNCYNCIKVIEITRLVEVSKVFVNEMLQCLWWSRSGPFASLQCWMRSEGCWTRSDFTRGLSSSLTVCSRRVFSPLRYVWMNTCRLQWDHSAPLETFTVHVNRGGSCTNTAAHRVTFDALWV